MTRGKKLKELRGKKKQKEVLEELERMGLYIDKNTLSNAENDKNISNTTLEILAKYYNVSLDYLKLEDVKNATNDNIKINKELGLTDKAIEKIKGINIIEGFLQEEFEIESNITMLNEFIEEFNGLKDFLVDLNFLKGHLELYKSLENLIYIMDLRTYLIDCYYNDKNKMNEIIEVIDTKVKAIVNLLEDGSRISIEVDNDTISELKEITEDIIRVLNSKTLTKDKKNELTEFLNELVEISLDLLGPLKEKIIFNRYELSSNINNYIENLNDVDLSLQQDKTNGAYLPKDEKLKQLILSGKKRHETYTPEDIKKYL